MRDHITVIGGGGECSREVRLELEPCAHSAQFEVAQPQLTVGEPGRLPVGIEYMTGDHPRIDHADPPSGPRSGPPTERRIASARARNVVPSCSDSRSRE